MAGFVKAKEINATQGAAGHTAKDSNTFYGTIFNPEGAQVSDSTVFCHDAFNKNRWACEIQIGINLMLKLHSAKDVLVYGVDSPAFIGMQLVKQRPELMKSHFATVF